MGFSIKTGPRNICPRCGSRMIEYTDDYYTVLFFYMVCYVCGMRVPVYELNYSDEGTGCTKASS